MSYILDALRRADSERERGAIPGIRAQQVPMQAAVAARSGRAAWIGGAAAAAVAAAVAWQLAARDAAQPTEVERAVAAAPPPPQTANTPNPVEPSTLRSPPTATPTPPAAAPAAPPAAATVPAPQVAATRAAPQAVKTSAAPQAAPKPAAAEEPKGLARPTAAPNAATRAAAEPARASASAAAAETDASRVHALHELPEHIRRELPSLSIGGSIYSEAPANRMLIVNGQLLHEKDKAARDVTLEQIKLKAAVLNYKGWRYELPY